MRRDFQSLGREKFDLLIVGGGITGSCIARDAAMRGLKVALVEKKDFSHATSAANSKLVHGGLRYLKNFELGLVSKAFASAASGSASRRTSSIPCPSSCPSLRTARAR